VLKKIFPAGVGNSPQNSFKLILVAEGYLAAESAKFMGDCVELIERLLETTPFNLTRTHPHWLSVYAAFQASANSGPAIDTPAAAGRTIFESSFNSAGRALSINQAKVNAYVGGETVPMGANCVPLPEFCVVADPSYGGGGTLIVLLLPAIASHPEGGEAENAPGANDYHFIATSKDGLYHQVVARTLARCLGLGDEFELAGNPYLQPSGGDIPEVLHFNLEYSESGPPNPLTSETKWYPLFGALDRNVTPTIHPKSSPTNPDLVLDSPPVTVFRVEFWEGGAGYRTKVWRTAHDCLMRRRIGDMTLPVRSGTVPFCPACRMYLSDLIW
jgi:hypothetical protein